MVQKNLNSLFAEIKKALERPETEDIHPKLPIKVIQARN